MKDFLLAYDLDTVDGFTKFVIITILDNIDSNPYIVEQTIEFGCSSGIIPELIYYYQTDEIFRHYFAEILEIYDTCIEQNLINNFEVNANNLVWLAFEYVTSILSNEYELVTN